MGMIAGTPTYMSPEQAEGRVDLIGTATDIYSLGAILYQILSGRMPYTGTSAQEIIQKVLLSSPHRSIRQALMLLLSKDPTLTC